MRLRAEVQFNQVEHAFAIPSITTKRVSQLLLSIPSHKATGDDGIRVKILKIGTPAVLPSLTRLLHLCISNKVFSSARKVAKVTPAFKGNGSRSDCNNYTLEVRRHLNAATKMYKAVHNWTHLSFPASVTLAHRSNRSNHPHKFRHIFARTNAYKFSFFPLVIPLWNGLPNSAVNAESVTDFQANALQSIGQYCNAM